METQTQPRSNKTVVTFAVIALLCFALGATIVYYNYALTQQTNSSNSETSNLKDEVNKLDSTLLALESSQGGNGTGLNSTGDTAIAIYAEAAKSVVTIEGDNVTTIDTLFGQYQSYSEIEGSGFVTEYANTMYIITNFHVVDGMSNMTITFSDGDAYPGTVVGSDVYADLAVVSVNAPASEFYPLTIANSSNLTVGEPVYAIGAPFGLSGTFTSGVVSQLGRTITEETAGNYSISGIVQFTAPINPGNSGGPLLDSDGQVVGITTATISGSEGLGFAVPSQTIIKELPSLIATGGYYEHSYLGIAGVDMNYQLAQASKTNVTYGVLVESVTAGSPAAKAGLQAGTKEVVVSDTQYLVGGDIIVSANGTKIIDLDALSSYLEENTVAGQNLVLGIIRDGVPMNVTVTLGARPQP